MLIKKCDPKIGGPVKTANGVYHGLRMRLILVYTDNYCAQVLIETGICDGWVLQEVVMKVLKSELHWKMLWKSKINMGIVFILDGQGVILTTTFGSLVRFETKFC